jgi:hypothetical protein
LYVPSGQLAHVRSVVAVGALFMYWPAAHGGRTSTHALPSSVAENVLPLLHARHSRSAVAEPAALVPVPAAHVRHAVQA